MSKTKDRKYPGCLPIFEQQAETCAAHFRRQESKCDVFSSARIDDFTDFACTVTVVEGGEEKTLGTKDAATGENYDEARARLKTERRKREAAWPKCEAAQARHRAAMSKQATCIANTGDPGACVKRHGPEVGSAFQETGHFCCSPVRFDFECDAYEEARRTIQVKQTAPGGVRPAGGGLSEPARRPERLQAGMKPTLRRRPSRDYSMMAR